jgi:hypothetical protein
MEHSPISHAYLPITLTPSHYLPASYQHPVLCQHTPYSGTEAPTAPAWQQHQAQQQGQAPGQQHQERQQAHA